MQWKNIRYNLIELNVNLFKWRAREFVLGAKYKIYITYYGAKGSGDPSPFYIKPKAYVEEEEMFEDEQRESRLPGYTAEDNPILSKPKSRKGKAPRC